MAKYVALGSNIEPRRSFLKKAIVRVGEFSEVKRVSPIYETAAALLVHASEEWNLPYLNCVLEIETSLSALEFLKRSQNIENEMGRKIKGQSHPRSIDIDILIWDELKMTEPQLKIPHPRFRQRSFVLDPLKDLNSSFLFDARELRSHSPLIMAILNLTPDSFSNSSLLTDRKRGIEIEQLAEMGVQILDVGAESTRPGAGRVSFEEEWARLKPFLESYSEARCLLAPKLSLDSYKTETVEKALPYGVDIINDVSGLTDLKMLNVLNETEASYVLMHSLGVPADPQKVLKGNIICQLKEWLEEKLELLTQNNIDLGRVIFDPGVGFGKSALQSLQILREIKEFKKYPVRIMVGHSRKSFMNGFAKQPFHRRDIETLGISMKLVDQGVDILRVHNPEWHLQALRGWGHVSG